jgi:hypothetical protein
MLFLLNVYIEERSTTYPSSYNYSNYLDDGDYERSSLFVAGKFADFKRQHAHHSHAVDVPALPRSGLKPAALKVEDDWGRRRQEGEEEDGNNILRKRMGTREEETEAQSRMVEGIADEESEYEDYEEEDGELKQFRKDDILGR